jgi:hypothetical protein
MSTPSPRFLTVNRAFSITGAWDVFRKFEWECRLHREASERDVSLTEHLALRESMWTAINAASTAWSLVEWAWIESEIDSEVKQRLLALTAPTVINQSSDLKSWARKNRYIDACWHIAHQSKHGEISRSVNDLFSTRVSLWHVGSPYADKWRQTGDVLWADATGSQPQRLSSRNLFVHVHIFWDELLTDLRIVERKVAIDLSGSD